MDRKHFMEWVKGLPHQTIMEKLGLPGGQEFLIDSGKVVFDKNQYYFIDPKRLHVFYRFAGETTTYLSEFTLEDLFFNDKIKIVDPLVELMKEGYKWVAKDENSKLYATSDKPYRLYFISDCEWIHNKNALCKKLDIKADYINWSDKSPYEIKPFKKIDTNSVKSVGLTVERFLYGGRAYTIRHFSDGTYQSLREKGYKLSPTFSDRDKAANWIIMDSMCE